jgi:hypothetical protein
MKERPCFACRYALCLGLWTCGAACQVVSALLLLREHKSSRHELLKARSFVATITVAMVSFGCWMQSGSHMLQIRFHEAGI